MGDWRKGWLPHDLHEEIRRDREFPQVVAREEAEHGPERAQSWKPEWVKLRDRITYSRDEKNLASSNEREENQW